MHAAAFLDAICPNKVRDAQFIPHVRCPSPNRGYVNATLTHYGSLVTTLGHLLYQLGQATIVRGPRRLTLLLCRWLAYPQTAHDTDLLGSADNHDGTHTCVWHRCPKTPSLFIGMVVTQFDLIHASSIDAPNRSRIMLNLLAV